MSAPNPLPSALAGCNTVLCVGAGGVGKTTVAATLALRSAVDGRSSLVCTIDPARRLANALGLSELGNEEARITVDQLEAAKLPATASMHAMMLDMKRTWDELIAKRAPPDKRDNILGNRFYQALSTALAGSQEYIAMEKLWELRSQRSYELVVLDTPPTAHALDFLDAPNRILDFLDNEAARWLLTPALAAGKVGLRLFNLGSSYVARQIAKLTGTETLQELADFMSSISGMNEGFRERAHQVRGLLTAETTRFVLVTAPQLERLDEAVHFHTLLRQSHMAIAAIVVNRVHVASPPGAWNAALHLPGDLRQKIERTLKESDVLAAQDARGVAYLRDRCGETPIIQLPHFEVDVHDLAALWQTGRYLFGDLVLGG